MLKQEFKDKVIAIFGASIDEHGYYMDNMRRFIANQTEKCYIVNRSIGGNYAMLACNMVEDEIDTLNPDVVFVHFGTNDIGVYNYNANVPETEEVIARREASVEKYFKYISLSEGAIFLSMNICSLFGDIFVISDIIWYDKDKLE